MRRCWLVGKRPRMLKTDQDLRALIPQLERAGLMGQVLKLARLSLILQDKRYTGQVVFHCALGRLKGYDLPTSLPTSRKVRWKE